MAGQFEASIEIDRPVAEVFAFLADGSNDPKFSPRVQRIDKTTDGPTAAKAVDVPEVQQGATDQTDAQQKADDAAIAAAAQAKAAQDASRTKQPASRSDPRGPAKSIVFTEEGLERARSLLEKLFGKQAE